MKFLTKNINKSKEVIAQADIITIITHFNPDGDAVGSSVALYHYFKILQKNVQIIFPNPIGHHLMFLLNDTEYIIAERNFKEAKFRLMQTNLLILSDMNAYHRTSEALENIFSQIKPTTILLDHHLLPDNFDITFSFPQASSSCEVVYHFLKRLSQRKIFNIPISTALYSGIMTDTGSLSFSCNNPDLYIVISNLLKSGINPTEINHNLFDTYSMSRLKLLGYAISKKMKIFIKQKAAFIYLNAEELKRFHYHAGDLEGVVNYCLKLEAISFCALISERDDKIHLSFRSKTPNIDVNKYARKYWNGGGHVMAAGGKCKKNFEDVVNELTNHIIHNEFIIKD